MTEATNHVNVSSAEMTAYWRSLYPALSSDPYSKNLVTPAGVQQCKHAEIKQDYPLIGRKISARAGFMYDRSVRALQTGRYDGLISFASGFSLLSYCVAEAMKQHQSYQYVDVDLPDMILERQEGLSSDVFADLDQKILHSIEQVGFDIEALYRNDRPLKDLFPNIKAPVFVLEGLMYFLSKPCVKWLVQQMASYAHTAVVLDYWPLHALEVSTCFKNGFEYWGRDNIREQIDNALWSEVDVSGYFKPFAKIEDINIQDFENQHSVQLGEQPQLVDINTFYPVHLVYAEK